MLIYSWFSVSSETDSSWSFISSKETSTSSSCASSTGSELGCSVVFCSSAKSSFDTWIFSGIFLARKIPEKIQVSKDDLAELQNTTEQPSSDPVEEAQEEEVDVSLDEMKDQEESVSDETENQE